MGGGGGGGGGGGELLIFLYMTRTTSADTIDAAPITGLVETRSGLAWSPPANAIGCSFDYVVTEDGSELTRIADISYDYTFPTCHILTITVTPVVPSTDQVLTSSSASINIFNSSTGKSILHVYYSM